MNPKTNLIDVLRSEEAKANRDDFVDVLRKLAHALSQPLTSIRGSVEIALLGNLDKSECREVLELVHQESGRMTGDLATLRDILQLYDSDAEIQLVSWTKCVEKVLNGVSAIGLNSLPRFVTDVEQNVWVKANLHAVNMATGRLISGAIKAGHGLQAVQVKLSARARVASLSVCIRQSPSPRGPGFAGNYADFSHGTPGETEVDWWLVRHAIESQGGWLKISEPSPTKHCYQINLPVDTPKVDHRP